MIQEKFGTRSFFSARAYWYMRYIVWRISSSVVSGWIEQIRRTVRPFSWVVSTQALQPPIPAGSEAWTPSVGLGRCRGSPYHWSDPSPTSAGWAIISGCARGGSVQCPIPNSWSLRSLRRHPGDIPGQNCKRLPGVSCHETIVTPIKKCRKICNRLKLIAEIYF